MVLNGLSVIIKESEILNIRVALQSLLGDANNIPSENIQTEILDKISKIDPSFSSNFFFKIERNEVFDDIFSNIFLSLLRILRKADLIGEETEKELKECSVF